MVPYGFVIPLNEWLLTFLPRRCTIVVDKRGVTMKVKGKLGDIASTALVWILIGLFLPWAGLILVGYLLYWPVEYVKIKRSRYQKDFPRKISFACGVHPDNEVYTLIKENDLPVEYIKWSEDYDLHGYFVSGDVLLDFTEPCFFDEKKGVWLYWPGDEEKEPMEVEADESEDEENTDDCLTIDGMKTLMLEQFSADVAGRGCNRVVMFYDRKRAEKHYGKKAVETLENEGFAVYERGELLQAIRSVIDE